MSSPIYLVRLVQVHESFRLAELDTLSKYVKVDIEVLEYSVTSPFCLIRFKTAVKHSPEFYHELAQNFISRSIIARGIYELWGQTASGDYDALHADVKASSYELWDKFRDVSFRFSLDSYCGKRSSREQREIIESFSYLGFEGKIQMRDADEDFVVFEDWDDIRLLSPTLAMSDIDDGATSGISNGGDEAKVARAGEAVRPRLQRLFFGRVVGGTRRWLAEKHDLKKRPYISTTSMDAELALVTATLAEAGPGKIFLDPFVGTGGFMVAAAELGAMTFGSDIDGRSFRGKGQDLEKGILANFRKYGISHKFGDCITSDLTNTPLRNMSSTESRRWLDGILCDPPYGVREGLKVLGRRVPRTGESPDPTADSRRAREDGPYLVDGVPSHTLPGFVAPKRPYSFNRMLGDILDFAARTLVDGGRLAFWMPCANEAEEDFPTPQHALLELKYTCVQSFNKWSRKLLVYERRTGEVAAGELEGPSTPEINGSSGRVADELNQFRRRYFQGFANGDSTKP